MRAVGMIVIKVGLEKTPEMPLVQHDDMVEHFTPDTADESLDVWVLLWTAGGDQHLLDPHVVDPSPKVRAIDAIAIPEQIPWCIVPRERLDHLLRCPRG